ncbi:MAG: cell division protein ZapA [Endomicrobiales bacterium]|nr:cell division protein ZapA [Endomicrobiales bacterium]
MEKVIVKILGFEYEVDTLPGDELFIAPIARYVEDKINELKRDTNIVDTQKLAVMAALSIAEELFRLKNTKEVTSGIMDKKTEELITMLDRAIST